MTFRRSSFLLVCAFISATTQAAGVRVEEVGDYVFGGYRGEFKAPPNADGNAKRALIVTFSGRAERLVFAHEGSYCPWFEFPDGSGVCYQFFEGNDGWAELFNQFGRMERNSFVDVVEQSPTRVWIRWTYFGVNQENGAAAYRGTEDFYCFPSGLVLRRQTYRTLMPADHRGYAREPIELIGMCPVGKLWTDVLRRDAAGDERHALIAIDPFSAKRYDVFWKHKADTLWQSTARRTGCDWKELDDARGIVLAIPMQAGTPFVIFGDASNFTAAGTRIKEHSHADTGGNDWLGNCWDHWPIGWLNSQGHPVDVESLKKFPNHFSPAGMDFFAMKNDEVEGKEFWSLMGVGGVDEKDVEAIRALARLWLSAEKPMDPATVVGLR